MSQQLRPNNFNEFIGQDKVKNTLKIIISSSIKRKKTLDHILLYGPPGVGKTSLATIIAKESGREIRYAQGSAMERKSDILTLLSTIRKNDIIFLDEIHAVNKSVEEYIYSAVEDGVIDIAIGPEGDSKIVRLNLPKFTLIGATTKIHQISEPLRHRFGVVSKLSKYSDEEIATIVSLSFKKLKFAFEANVSRYISEHARSNPRIANNLVKRVIDFATMSNEDIVKRKTAMTTFDSIGIYEYGLDESHIEYLKTLFITLDSSWSSIDNLSAILGITKNNAVETIEHLLIMVGLISKSSKGRKITNLGIQYLKRNKLL